MTIRTAFGNALIAFSSTVGASTSVIVTNAIDNNAFSKPYVLAGFPVPNWVGIVFFFVFMCVGVVMAVNQPTSIDHKFKYPKLKPLYSFTFGIIATVFGLPLIYPDMTIWHMLIPILFFTSIGAAVMYYVIDFFTSAKLWLMISDWGYKSIAEYLKGLPGRIKAALKAFVEGDK